MRIETVTCRVGKPSASRLKPYSSLTWNDFLVKLTSLACQTASRATSPGRCCKTNLAKSEGNPTD